MELETFVAALGIDWRSGLAGLALLLFAARGAGCWLLPRRGGEFRRFALGVAALAWLYPWYWRSVPERLTLFLLLIPAVRGVWKFPLGSCRRHWRLLLVLAAAGGVTLGSALLPPFTWDEQVYQTVLWSRFPETAWRIDNPYAAYPLLPQLFMQWGRGAGSLLLPRLLVWACSLILAGGLYIEARRRCGSAALAGVLTAGVMLSPLALTLEQSFYAETLVALFALAGFLTLEPGTGDDRSDAVAAGVFAGACVAVKLTGIAPALLLLVLAVRRWRLPGRFVAAAAVTALPFFLRVWVVFGQPVYPFFARWFGGERMELVEKCFRALGDYGVGRLRGVGAGWLLACVDKEFSDGVVGGFVVLAVVVSLAVLVALRRGRRAWRGALALAAGYLFWALTSQQSRFLYPLVFPAVLLLARLLPKRSCRPAVRALLAVLVLAGVADVARSSYPRLRHCITAWRMLPAAQKAPVRFLALATNDPAYFNTLKLLGAVAPERARVLLLFERRSLYLPRRFEHGTPLFQERRLTPPPRTPEELWRAIREFDYLLLGSTQEHIDRLPEYAAVEAHTKRLVVELVIAGRLRPVPGPPGVAFQPLFEVVP